jgi:hypothetical protein
VGPEARARVETYLAGLPLADKAGFVVIHYQGNTSPSEKDLSHPDVAGLLPTPLFGIWHFSRIWARRTAIMTA